MNKFAAISCCFIFECSFHSNKNNNDIAFAIKLVYLFFSRSFFSLAIHAHLFLPSLNNGCSCHPNQKALWVLVWLFRNRRGEITFIFFWAKCFATINQAIILNWFFPRKIWILLELNGIYSNENTCKITTHRFLLRCSFSYLISIKSNSRSRRQIFWPNSMFFWCLWLQLSGKRKKTSEKMQKNEVTK